MTMLVTALELVGGLAALTGGATVFVDGASGLARRFHIPPLVIGLTIVSLGTSAPEVGVNVVAAFSGQPALAVGNVLGSNLFNILAVLGSCALFAPLVVGAQVVRVDVPVMIGTAGLLYAFAFDGRVSTAESVGLVLLLIAYTFVQVVLARRAQRARPNGPVAAAEETDALPPRRPLAVQIGSILVGAALLVSGSDWLVDGATTVARALEVDDRIIGLTVVAIGTSLPELAASLIATVKGERDIAVGNVVGSNIYNVLAVVGLTGVVAQGGIEVSPDALGLDFPMVLAASVACLPIFFVGWRIERWEGGLFLAYYVAYLAYLVFDATQHGLASHMAAAVPLVLPLTLVTAVVLWTRMLREPPRDPSVGS